MRQISSRFLSQDDRIQIADLHNAGLDVRQIAQRLSRAPSTISRELRRNVTSGELRVAIGELLDQRWSSQQISRYLWSRFLEESGMWLCHESIYQAIYQPGSVLLRPSKLAPHRRSPLRTGRDHRRTHQHTKRQTRMVRLLHLPQRDSEPLHAASTGNFPKNSLS